MQGNIIALVEENEVLANVQEIGQQIEDTLKDIGFVRDKRRSSKRIFFRGGYSVWYTYSKLQNGGVYWFGIPIEEYKKFRFTTVLGCGNFGYSLIITPEELDRLIEHFSISEDGRFEVHITPDIKLKGKDIDLHHLVNRWDILSQHIPTLICEKCSKTEDLNNNDIAQLRLFKDLNSKDILDLMNILKGKYCVDKDRHAWKFNEKIQKTVKEFDDRSENNKREKDGIEEKIKAYTRDIESLNEKFKDIAKEELNLEILKDIDQISQEFKEKFIFREDAMKEIIRIDMKIKNDIEELKEKLVGMTALNVGS